jgi:ParB-like nuclease domain
MVTPEEFAALREDIKAHGVKMPVIVWQEQILDGRHRARACDELGIAVPTQVFEGDEAQALALVISLNAARRDLKPTQRAMVAARLANNPHGTNQYSKGPENLPILTINDAAKSLGISERLVRAARFVLQNGSPEMVANCERGEQSALDVETLIRRLQTALIENHQANLQREIEAEHAAARATQEAERDTPMPDVVERCQTILELI